MAQDKGGVNGFHCTICAENNVLWSARNQGALTRHMNSLHPTGKRETAGEASARIAAAAEAAVTPEEEIELAGEDLPISEDEIEDVAPAAKPKRATKAATPAAEPKAKRAYSLLVLAGVTPHVGDVADQGVVLRIAKEYTHIANVREAGAVYANRTFALDFASSLVIVEDGRILEIVK